MVISKGKSLDFGSKFAIFFRRRRPKIELYGIGVQKTIGFVPPYLVSQIFDKGGQIQWNSTDLRNIRTASNQIVQVYFQLRL